MKVKMPRNLSDEELSSMPEDFDRPVHEPTIMTCTIQRFRLGQVAREIADLHWSKPMNEVTIEDVQAIDARFNRLFTELPVFLRMDEDSMQETSRMIDEKPWLLLQRYNINMVMHAVRCKFHVPYLLKASVDPDYTFSRMACLRAARWSIRVRDRLHQEPSPLWLANPRLGGMVHMFFYATMVLVLDLIVNRGAECESARKREIQQAFQILEEAGAHTTAGGLYLNSLLAILKKHSIRLSSNEQDAVAGHSGSGSPGQSTGGFAPGHNTAFAQPQNVLQADPAPLRPADSANIQTPHADDLDHLWQSYFDVESIIEPQQWDALLNELDSFPLEAEPSVMNPGY